ncbi:monovalent cation/H+ antiporter complex subunit F [Lutibaculum baratangense]|uniref:Multiple resistance and pH regulation protein F n=1 Tax=Lutibaculum baratangense AMV1 TaxID=631454 RepID=V4TE76_9HYPH|nr:monovalent cation/H+ antiporter complex subunit F [Lutibaculum baratangense]ESR24513.1 multiple resistance and pH regulation protein F [Lutibaculum baratangense AMV1]
MDEFLYLACIGLLGTVAASLVRVHLGPNRADRMMGAQLIGTGGVAIALVLAGAARDASMIDVALVLALLASFAAVAFVKATSADGAGDPEEDG